MEKKKPAANGNHLQVKIPKKIATNKKEECNFKELKIVSNGCYHIFTGKKLPNNEYVKMFETIRAISNTEVGLTYLVSKHYEDTILKRGMEALREEVKEKPGHSFLVKLGEVWLNFYQNILPTLLSLFYCIPTHGNSVKQMTFVSFRNLVVLQLKFDEALSANELSVPQPIKQMLCVLLQAVHDNTEQYYKLEALAARVINPFLGSKGLYVRKEVNKEYLEGKANADRYSSISMNDSNENSPETTVRSQSNKHRGSIDDDFELLMNYRRQQYTRYQGGPQRLSCVEEKETGISESLASLIADGFEVE